MTGFTCEIEVSAEGLETEKVSQCQRTTPKIQVLAVPWDIRALNRKGNNLICSLPISIFLFLFLLQQNENQLFISSQFALLIVVLADE